LQLFATDPADEGDAMSWRNSDTDWSTPIKLLHWLLALAVIAIAALGIYMKYGDASAVGKIRLYALHKSLGLTVLALALLRLAIRIVDRRRPLSPPMPRWQHAAATVSHVLLYLVLIGMPLTGWLYNSASGFPLQWFGRLQVPALAARDPELKALAGGLHAAGLWLLVAVVALHAGAALRHHFVDRDNVLRSMLPRLGRPRA
jgi:cytochrome b561